VIDFLLVFIADLKSGMTGHIIPRVELVNLLHQRLSDYKIIHVTQSAAIAHRNSHFPRSEVLPHAGKPPCATYCSSGKMPSYIIEGWAKDKHYADQLKELCGDFHPTRPTYLLFDEGQNTYSDTNLWNFFFKSLRLMGNMHVAPFCCYGSTSSRVLSSAPDTPDVFDQSQRLCLFPTPEVPLGIFMTRDEFKDLLDRYPHRLTLADDVKREILEWSAGHIGGIEYLLDSIRRKVRVHCSEFRMLPKAFC